MRQWQKILKSEAAQADGIPISRHIYLHLSIFGIVMFLGIVLAFAVTSNIVPNTRSAAAVMLRERNKALEDIREHFGGAAAETVSLSKMLSSDIESILSDAGISFSGLSANGALLSELLDRETDLLQLSLERANCSGVFLILDTTINPNIEGSENSRAGVYIRRVEPKRIGNPSEMLYLRGNTQFAIKRGMTLQANWNLEFDISGRSLWTLPLSAHASGIGRSLADLYVWSFGVVVPEAAGNSLICSIPLVDSNGNALGVCGLEISQTNFRYSHSVETERYTGLVLAFSGMNSGVLNLSNALYSGNMEASAKLSDAGYMNVPNYDDANAPERYSVKDEYYRVTYAKTPLYANSSYFANSQFALSVLLPESAHMQELLSDILRFSVILLSMLALGVILSFILSNRLAKPLSATVHALKNAGSEEFDDKLTVGIRELDELLQLYAKKNPGQPAQLGAMFTDFIEKLKQLTPAELTISALYMRGKSFDEIREELSIAVSTLKTHNIHIYKKLNIKGADELRLYMELISRSNFGSQLAELLSP